MLFRSVNVVGCAIFAAVSGSSAATCATIGKMSLPELKKRGWKFVGPTTIFAFMQAMGLVDDHIDGCERRP